MEFAYRHLDRRMQDLGYGQNYYKRLRHFILKPSERIHVEAYGSYFVLAEEPERIQIKSQNGYFDTENLNMNEQQYEHHGKISIQNFSTQYNHVRFVQAIPFK
jgi:hypothetical protein